MVNTYVSEIKRMHEKLDKSICEDCKSICSKKNEKISPIFFPYVGENYRKGKIRPLFVGKNARGFVDYQEFGQGQFFGDGRKYAFWSYIAGIANNLGVHPDGVAISNLVKCNNSMEEEGRNNGSSKDFTPDQLKVNCIQKNKVIWEEIDILDPTHVILFTHNYYDKYLKGFIALTNNTVACGMKNIVWDEGALKSRKGTSIQCLRTSHPERRKKEDFVKLVSEWVNN